MSSRQLRRLQGLVDRATGLDADDQEEDTPMTMQMKKPHQHKRKRKIQKEEEDKKHDAGTVADVVWSRPAEILISQEGSSAGRGMPSADTTGSRQVSSSSGPTSSATAMVRPPLQRQPLPSITAADEWEEVAEDGKEEGATCPSDSRTAGGVLTQTDEAAAAREAAAEEEKKRKRAEKKRKARQQQQRLRQAEEEALLDAVLACREGDTADSTSSPRGSPVADHHSPVSSPRTNTSAPAGDASLLHFVMACETQQLDVRLERIRVFGADAVEDVGDGRTTHRRADGRVRDTGSTSFFPLHHRTVKFVNSAFATPNCYRWAPYDSLGVYVTTAEVQDPSGQSRRDYFLICSSNAFRRAQASLELCQQVMGGVQDLIDCLARHHVYHIPTLLQCMYAMEATGDSAIAAELLEVALYQVGVLLRRFPLSGTWCSRQLPYEKSANSLIFQVLQRGVHAALKRGCLHTAFERTRCLLSLDVSDPCGMLLLLDYTALRAKKWTWLLEVRHRALAVLASCRETTSDTPPMKETKVSAAVAADDLALSDVSLAQEILRLPNFAFSWALAKHFIERDDDAHQRSIVAGDTVGRPSKLRRALTDAQRIFLDATPSALELLKRAMIQIPLAALRLVEALGGPDVFCDDGDALRAPLHSPSAWQELVERADAARRSTSDADTVRLVDLFVARHEELWKMSECVALLREAVQFLMQTAPLRDAASAGAGAEPENTGGGVRPLTDMRHTIRHPPRYSEITRDFVMGSSVAPIPAELLEPGAPVDHETWEEDRADAEGPGTDDDHRLGRLQEILRQHLPVLYFNDIAHNVQAQPSEDLEGSTQEEEQEAEEEEALTELEYHSVASADGCEDENGPGLGDS